MNHRIIQRVYVDACAIGGLFNQYAEQTKPFWDAVCKGEITIIVSDILDGEVKKAPKVVRDFYNGLPESQIERVVSTDESNTLAERYIAEQVVGPTSLDDCKHIALATIAKADVLVSWNFRHIVNVTRIKGYNGVNMILGLKSEPLWRWSMSKHETFVWPEPIPGWDMLKWKDETQAEILRETEGMTREEVREYFQQASKELREERERFRTEREAVQQ